MALYSGITQESAAMLEGLAASLLAQVQELEARFGHLIEDREAYQVAVTLRARAIAAGAQEEERQAAGDRRWLMENQKLFRRRTIPAKALAKALEPKAPRGPGGPCSRLTIADCERIVALAASGDYPGRSGKDRLGAMFGVGFGTVYTVIRGWRPAHEAAHV